MNQWFIEFRLGVSSRTVLGPEAAEPQYVVLSHWQTKGLFRVRGDIPLDYASIPVCKWMLIICYLSLISKYAKKCAKM